MIKKVLRQFRRNPLEGAELRLSPSGQAIWKGVVAIERPDWSDPVLFTHPSLGNASAQPESVRLEKGHVIWKRGITKNDVVISGFDLKKVDDISLDWDWEIFRAPDKRYRRHTRTILE